MSVLIKGTNIEDLQRAMLMFSGHEIVELPDHGDLIDRDALNPMFVHGRLDDTYVSRKELLGAPVVIPAERSE